MNLVPRSAHLYWLETEFSLVGAFSLRPSNTTATSGRSLLVPTPYAIKMALLDQLISWRGAGFASTHFGQIRNLGIWIDPPEFIVVSHLTRHIFRITELKKWQGNVHNQQYCIYSNPFRLCFGSSDSSFIQLLEQLVPGLEYLGQRGGFIQNLGVVARVDMPMASFIDLQLAADSRKLSLGIIQRMDDMQATISFDDVSRFSLGKSETATRHQYDLLLPYHVERSSIHDVVYRRHS